MCGLDLFAVGKIDCKGGYHGTFIVHGGTFHDEDGSCAHAHVHNCLFGGNCYGVEELRHWVSKKGPQSLLQLRTVHCLFAIVL